MRYAIIESGGKQYRAVEGTTVDVDRLPIEAGKEFNLENVLFMADGDEVMVGTPSVSGILVKATVVGHVKGPKVISFKYRPKKRIRVKGGHRHQYTRLRVDFIGRPDEERKREKAAAPVPKEDTAAAPKAPAKKKSTAKTAAPKKPAAPKKTTKK